MAQTPVVVFQVETEAGGDAARRCHEIWLEEGPRLTTNIVGCLVEDVHVGLPVEAVFEDLGRVYFPGVDFGRFTDADKSRIEQEIAEDFAHAYEGIQRLPEGTRFGVYLAYVYYRKLFAKIRSIPADRIREGKSSLKATLEKTS